MPPDALTDAQRHALLAVFARHAGHVERVDLFGSRARGTHRAGSDIDLAVVDDGDDAAFADLLAALDTADISVAVDVVRYRDLSAGRLADEVARDAIPLFTRSELAAAARD